MDARVRRTVPEISVGIGDEIMASAQVKKLYERTGLPVLIVDRRSAPRWHEMWENNPKIIMNRGRRHVQLMNGGGARPYIARKTATHWTWKRWEIEPGEIYLSDAELRFALPYAGKIMIEPRTKVPNGNKAWRWERWQQVVSRSRPGSFIQVGRGQWLDGTVGLATTFRQACAVLSVSRGFVGTEGGLHHAAAALGQPAVVLWSEFIHPVFTGYATQRNLRHAVGVCGARVACDGCKASMDAITVDEVLTNLEEAC